MRSLSLILLLFLSVRLIAQSYRPTWESLNQRGIPQWFNEEKFGIFIHWGPYAVPAFAPVIPNSGLSYSEWYWQRIESRQKEFIDFHEKNYGRGFPYQDLEKSFRAELFDPAFWASIFKRAGARYVVLTSKHHDGYTLWENEQADKHWGRIWNAVKGAPGRDLLGDLTRAVRDSGMRMGYYYSLYEWFNPLWKANRERFVDEHMIPQFKDLVEKYSPSLIFSDGEWDMSDTAWKSRELLTWLFSESPVAKEVVVNDRWGNNTRHKNNGATYTTSEYGAGMDSRIIWEESRGIGHSYGYNRNETADDYKSGKELILILVDIVARGGNLLLDIGPTADGRIPVIMQQRLLDIGEFLAKNGEAIYGTKSWKNPYQWSAGPQPEKKGESYMAAYDIAELVKPKKDVAHIEYFFTRKQNDLFCFLPEYSSEIVLKDINPAAGTDISLLSSGTRLPFQQRDQNLHIDLSGISSKEILEGMLVIRLENALKQ